MKKILTLSGLLILLCCYSCKKNQLGGKSTIEGSVMHHARLIPNAIVYIKFNAKDFPGADLSAYDDKVTADADGHYSIKCYKGDYYLYGVGYDDQIQDNVYGGLPVHIRNKEKVQVDVAVTE
jgi:hypothetical protein